jgi:hypothetical protein
MSATSRHVPKLFCLPSRAQGPISPAARPAKIWSRGIDPLPGDDEGLVRGTAESSSLLCQSLTNVDDDVSVGTTHWLAHQRGDRLVPHPQEHRPPRQVPARLVHSIPGRFRLAFVPGATEQGRSLARQLQVHPRVRTVRWNPAARSLTVEHDLAVDVRQLIGMLPPTSSPAQASAAGGGIAWGRVMRACLPCLLPLGPVTSLALTLLVAILEQTMAPSRSTSGSDHQTSRSVPHQFRGDRDSSNATSAPHTLP